jgi:hypothetical protein
MPGAGAEDPIEMPAGVPSERSNKVILLVASAILGIPLLGLLLYVFVDMALDGLAETLAEVAVPALGQPGEARRNFKAGDTLVFSLATSYSCSGNSSVSLEVSLQRDGAEVAQTRCSMKSFTGLGASGSGTVVWYGDGWKCTLDVPPGGATSIRATVVKKGDGSLTLSDTSVLVKRR